MTRKQKIKFLNDLMVGKASAHDMIEPIEGMVFIDKDKVFMYTTIKGTTVFEPEIPLSEFEAIHCK